MDVTRQGTDNFSMRSLLLALVLVLALAAPAGAQNATQDGYSGAGPQAIERTGGPGSGSGGSGSLPFTGLDLLLVAGLGAGLLGIGAGMRRLTQPDAAHQTTSH